MSISIAIGTEKKICRLCLTILKDLDAITDSEKDIIQIVIPQINLDNSDHPVICKDCGKSLQHSFSFKTKCLEIEDNIHDFKKDDQEQVNLEKILGIQVDDNKCVRICRTCLQYLENDTFTELDTCDSPLRSVLAEYLPEMDVKLTIKPVMCLKCEKTLKESYQFYKLCLDNEKKIQYYFENSNKRDLNIYDIGLYESNKDKSSESKVELESELSIKEDAEGSGNALVIFNDDSIIQVVAEDNPSNSEDQVTGHRYNTRKRGLDSNKIIDDGCTGDDSDDPDYSSSESSEEEYLISSTAKRFKKAANKNTQKAVNKNSSKSTKTVPRPSSDPIAANKNGFMQSSQYTVPGRPVGPVARNAVQRLLYEKLILRLHGYYGTQHHSTASDSFPGTNMPAPSEHQNATTAFPRLAPAESITQTSMSGTVSRSVSSPKSPLNTSSATNSAGKRNLVDAGDVIEVIDLEESHASREILSNTTAMSHRAVSNSKDCVLTIVSGTPIALPTANISVKDKATTYSAQVVNLDLTHDRLGNKEIFPNETGLCDRAVFDADAAISTAVSEVAVTSGSTNMSVKAKSTPSALSLLLSKEPKTATKVFPAGTLTDLFDRVVLHSNAAVSTAVSGAPVTSEGINESVKVNSASSTLSLMLSKESQNVADVNLRDANRGISSNPTGLCDKAVFDSNSGIREAALDISQGINTPVNTSAASALLLSPLNSPLVASVDLTNDASEEILSNTTNLSDTNVFDSSSSFPTAAPGMSISQASVNMPVNVNSAKKNPQVVANVDLTNDLPASKEILSNTTGLSGSIVFDTNSNIPTVVSGMPIPSPNVNMRVNASSATRAVPLKRPQVVANVDLTNDLPASKRIAYFSSITIPPAVPANDPTEGTTKITEAVTNATKSNMDIERNIGSNQLLRLLLTSGSTPAAAKKVVNAKTAAGAETGASRGKEKVTSLTDPFLLHLHQTNNMKRRKKPPPNLLRIGSSVPVANSGTSNDNDDCIIVEEDVPSATTKTVEQRRSGNSFSIPLTPNQASNGIGVPTSVKETTDDCVIVCEESTPVNPRSEAQVKSTKPNNAIQVNRMKQQTVQANVEQKSTVRTKQKSALQANNNLNALRIVELKLKQVSDIAERNAAELQKEAELAIKHNKAPLLSCLTVYVCNYCTFNSRSVSKIASHCFIHESRGTDMKTVSSIGSYRVVFYCVFCTNWYVSQWSGHVEKCSMKDDGRAFAFRVGNVIHCTKCSFDSDDKGLVLGHLLSCGKVEGEREGAEVSQNQAEDAALSAEVNQNQAEVIALCAEVNQNQAEDVTGVTLPAEVQISQNQAEDAICADVTQKQAEDAALSAEVNQNQAEEVALCAEVNQNQAEDVTGVTLPAEVQISQNQAEDAICADVTQKQAEDAALSAEVNQNQAEEVALCAEVNQNQAEDVTGVTLPAEVQISQNQAEDAICADVTQKQAEDFALCAETNHSQAEEITLRAGVNQSQAEDVTDVTLSVDVNKNQTEDAALCAQVNQKMAKDLSLCEKVNQIQAEDVALCVDVNQNQAEDNALCEGVTLCSKVNQNMTENLYLCKEVNQIQAEDITLCAEVNKNRAIATDVSLRNQNKNNDVTLFVEVNQNQAKDVTFCEDVVNQNRVEGVLLGTRK